MSKMAQQALNDPEDYQPEQLSEEDGAEQDQASKAQLFTPSTEEPF